MWKVCKTGNCLSLMGVHSHAGTCVFRKSSQLASKYMEHWWQNSQTPIKIYYNNSQYKFLRVDNAMYQVNLANNSIRRLLRVNPKVDLLV